MYIVDSIEEVYKEAEKRGIPILQKYTKNIMGGQGRLDFTPVCHFYCHNLMLSSNDFYTVVMGFKLSNFYL